MTSFSIDSQIGIMTNFSNHFEGTAVFYTRFEKEIKRKLQMLNFSQVVKVLQIFYNTKKGTKNFVKEMLERADSLINVETFDGKALSANTRNPFE